MRKPLPVCVRALRALVPSLLLTLGGGGLCHGGIIASSNFTSGSAADSLPAVTWTPTLALGSGVPANDSYASISASGTVDTTTNTGGAGPFTAGTRGNALKTNVNFTGATGSTWTGAMQTPILSVSNAESALDRLNVSFDMECNRTLPVRFRVESFTSTSSTPTGALEGLVIPPTYNNFYRYSVDLSTLTRPAGLTTTFAPTGTNGARIRFTFYLDGGTGGSVRWPNGTNNIVIVDNICYTSPTRWVAANGNAGVTGTTSTAPTTVQHAYDLVQPGDVICFLGGTTYSNIPSLQAKGTPSRWITLRAAPGAAPLIKGTNWSAFSILGTSAYIDIHGFTVQGIYDDTNATNAASQVTAALSDGALLNTYSGQEKNPAYTIYSGDPYGRSSNTYYGSAYYNTNGIYLNGKQKSVSGSIANTADDEGIHHVRVADNTVLDMPGAGIAAAKSDYVFFENNVVKECAHLSRYGTSGITAISNVNFDGSADTKIFVVANECARNRGDVPWNSYTGSGNSHVVHIRFSDGNGIIMDVNRNRDYDGGTLPPYQGRTLVQNNVSYLSGGSGVHTVGAAHVDVVNNTAFNNNQPNQATGTFNEVTYTQSTAFANAYPTATYTTDKKTQNTARTSLGYGQLFAGYKSQDVHLFNNVAWAPAGGDINAGFPTDGSAITYNNNVFGRYGADGGVYETGFTAYYSNKVVSADPLKIFTSVTVGDSTFLRLQGGSANYPGGPALNAGVNAQGTPFLDLDGDYRPVGSGFDAGAYEVDY